MVHKLIFYRHIRRIQVLKSMKNSLKKLRCTLLLKQKKHYLKKTKLILYLRLESSVNMLQNLELTKMLYN